MDEGKIPISVLLAEGAHRLSAALAAHGISLLSYSYVTEPHGLMLEVERGGTRARFEIGLKPDYEHQLSAESFNAWCEHLAGMACGRMSLPELVMSFEVAELPTEVAALAQLAEMGTTLS